MARENFGVRLLKRREFFIYRARHEPMQLLAPAPEQCFVRRVPDQRVLEGVTRFGRNPTNVDCMSSEPSGQVSNRFKRGFGPSELKLWLRLPMQPAWKLDGFELDGFLRVKMI